MFKIAEWSSKCILCQIFVNFQDIQVLMKKLEIWLDGVKINGNQLPKIQNVLKKINS